MIFAAFISTVGNGSRSKDVFGEDVSICLSSSTLAGTKEKRREFICGCYTRLYYLTNALGKKIA